MTSSKLFLFGLLTFAICNFSNAQTTSNAAPASAPAVASTPSASATPASSVTQAGGNWGKEKSAQDKELPKPVLNPKKPVKISYRVTKPDANMVIIIRDSKSGRMAKLEVQGYNQATQSIEGTFTVNFADADEVIYPEVYVVPSSLMQGPDQYKKIGQLIKDEVLLRKPFFLRLDLKNAQAITVYDTRDQVLEAFNEFRKLPSGKDVVDKAALEAQAAAKAAAEAARLEALKVAQEKERLRIQEEENRKTEELKRQQEQLAEAERNRRKKIAEDTVKEALTAYKAEKFALAEEKFKAAIQMDPSNEKYYFQLGVTQYKLERYNEAIVSMNQAKAGDYNPLEKDYFLGMSYWKLKESGNAADSFHKIKAANDKTFSSTAAFYAGVIEFGRENYDIAKSDFEYVLDTTEDKAMDAQAEAYIEQIVAIKQFQAEQKKTFLFTANIGLINDTNILNTPPGSEPSASGLAGWRMMWSGSAEYRPIYKMNHEWSVIANYGDMYSYDKSFKSATAFQNTDPLTTAISFPYKYKGLVLGKGYQLTLSPSIESTSMNADGTGAREKVLGSTALKADQTFVMSDDWFATYTLEFRNDTPASVTTEIDDSTATKITLGTSQTFFQDKKKTEAYIGDFSYALNSANGDNADYTKLDLGGTYMKPIFTDRSLISRLGLTNTNYSNHASSRKDSTMNLMVAYRQPIKEDLAATASLTYTNNSSNVDSSKYNKFMLNGLLTWTPSF